MALIVKHAELVNNGRMIDQPDNPTPALENSPQEPQKNNLFLILIILMTAVIAGSVGFILGSQQQRARENPIPDAINNTPMPTTSDVVCTADAKICPDGSAVGRIGPNCEFEECPSQIINSEE